MPTEIRRIIFSNEELQHAINMMESKNIPKLPEGRVLSAATNEEDSAMIDLAYQNYNREEQSVIQISTANIGAVLINYCIKCKIPLARGSTKTIKIMGDNISLQLTYQNDVTGKQSAAA